MAVEVEITGRGVYAGAKSAIETYRVTEDSTPTEASDSSGGTGQIKFNAIEDPSRFGSALLLNDLLELTDGDRGVTAGTISDITSDDGVMNVTADSRLGRLVINKSALAVHDTFPNVMRYYLSLGGIPTEMVAIDASFNGITVNAPSWTGDLWTKIKELCVTYGAEISLLRTNVAVRPVRERRALEINNSSESWTISNRDLAKEVEVYYYNSQWKASAIIYPKNGWDERMPIYTIDAGESLVVNIPINVSVESIVQPSMFGSVGRYYMGPSSAYSVLGADNFPVLIADWTSGGGSLTFAPGANGRSIDMTLIAPRVGSVAAQNAPFRIAFSDDQGVYSSIRLIGTGLHFEPQSIVVPTGADESMTSRDVGVTVDNLFISTESQARSLALDVASRWASPQRTLRITKAAINKPGDTDQDYDFATFADFDAYAATNGIVTFANFDTAWAGDTFADFDNYWYEQVQDEFDFQVFGNAAGARIPWRRAMYRIRTVDIGPDEISYTAEEDTTIGDFDASANSTPVYTWITQRTNFAPNPRADSLTTFGPATQGTRSIVSTMPGAIPTAIRWTRTTDSTAARVLDIIVGTTMPAAGQTVTVRGVVRSSVAGATLSIAARPQTTSSTNQTTLGAITIAQANVAQPFSFTAPSFNVATTSTSGVVAVNTGTLNGATFDFTALQIEVGAGGDFFDGNTPAGGPSQRNTWAGTAGASSSFMQVGTVTSYTSMTIGDFDASYAGLTFADFALIPLPNVLPELERW